MKHLFATEIESHIDTLAAELPHALLLYGPSGVGLTTLALQLAGVQLAGIIRPTDAKGNDDMTSSGVIRVEQIRDMTSHAINKTRQHRVYIIDGAERMNAQAQNAFLKLLEEPSLHVHFLLVTHELERLLPTVVSRTQRLSVPPITVAQSEALLDTLRVHDKATRAQLLFLASGLPAELTRLVQDTELFQARAVTITAARQFLQGTVMEKLEIIHTCSADRPRTLELLYYAQRVLNHSLTQKPSTALVERAEQLSAAYDTIAANGHIRIQLARLVV
jgi:DNA polymerase-3 subunit delta'